MKAICIAPLYNFGFTAPSVVVHVEPSFIITNDRKKLQRYLSICPNFERMIGYLEFTHLQSGCPVAIRELELDERSLEFHLIDFLYTVQVLSNALWINGDSCVDTELGFAFEFEGDFKVTSNMIQNGFTSSACSATSISMGFSEVEKIVKHLYPLFRRDMEFSVGNKTFLKKGTNRLTRAIYHFTGARSTAVAELKVANYCSGFEALLSTSNSELSHQLSERISVLLESTREARIKLYRDMKKIYEIRSKVVHGSTVETERLLELCEMSDGIARRLIELALTDEIVNETLNKTDSGKIDEFFLGKLFELQAT